MEELIINIAEYAYPAQESIKDSDFSVNVKNLKEYIISIFRNLSLQFVPPFLNGFLLKIESDAKSDDKRKRYAAAVCLSSLFDLFPIDEYISQYKRVIEPLLVPGYKPILHIGAIVVGNLALIIGNSKDLFLHNLVLKCFNDLQVNKPPDVRYAAAVVWNELAKTIPEIFYTLSNFEWIILENLQSGDRIICEILINVLYSLFTSESSSVGSSFLLELQDLLISTTTKNFLDSTKTEQIIIYFQLLNLLLKLKPYFSKKMAEDILFAKCVSLLKNKHFEIMMYSIETIIRLYEVDVIQVERKLFDDIIDVLFEWSKELPMNTLQIFEKFLLTFPTYLDDTSETFLQRLSSYHKIQDGPLFVYNMIVTVIASVPSHSNIVHYLSFLTKMMSKSNVPIPIYTILSTLNSKRPKWTMNYIYFMNQVMYVIRQELISQSSNTARLNIALLALIQIPIRDLDDALELNALLMTLVSNKDIQVREKIAETSIHLFTNMPDKIPLNTIIKIVKFALDDTIRSVRLNSIRAFKPMTYKLLSQPDVFPIFCRFAYDESPEVRKEALLIFSSLPAVTGTIVRNILLSSLKQITSEKECLTSETISMWIVFPRLLVAATPWLNIYAEAIFEKFINILDHRFTLLLSSEAALGLMNSAMFQDMDESLIKSIGKLYRICPDLISIDQILSVYIKILNCPVHPRTKIHVMKSLKNLGKIAAIYKIMPNIASVLIEIILTSKSKKLVAKSMKVIGSIGFSQFQGNTLQSTPFFFRNSLTNQRVLKFYFVSNLIHFLNEEFKATNIEKNRENIACIITLVFKLQPEMITRHLEPFFGTYLKFIHDSTERPPVFFHYLRKIIEFGGHLMMEKAKTIYNSIQRDWQSSGVNTKKASEVFRSLVTATIGQCEVVLNPLISESFILLKIPTKSQIYAPEIFELLKTIARLAPSYLSTIISGIAEFLSQSYSLNIQELSLEAIKYMVHHCKIENHLSFIKRCIGSILLRPQQRFRDIATYILNEVNSVTRSQSIEKIAASATFNKMNRIAQQNAPSVTTIEQIHHFNLSINKLISHLDINAIIRAEESGITEWFAKLNKLLLPPTSSDLMKAMGNLQQQPEFTFEFAFIQVWNSLEILTQKEIAHKLEIIFKYEQLQDFVLEKFSDLIEFSILCEINLDVDIILVAQRCEKAHLYDKALFFYETYLIYNPNSENNVSAEFKRSLICMNQIVGRSDDAHSIALQSRDVMTHETWMKLGEWELALQQFTDNDNVGIKEDPNHFIIDQIICYAALDDWESILKFNNHFKNMQVFDQSRVAQYFWTARFYNDNKNLQDDSSLNSFNMSCVYSVQECVEKAILNLRENKAAQAYEYVHLGWRYASASISAESKNSNNCEIGKLLFHAQQLYELNRVISLFRSNNFKHLTKSKSNKESTLNKSQHIWHTRLKFLKTNPIYQKELYKICSLVQSDTKSLETFAFRILESTSKSQYAPLIPKMKNLFFPDSESDRAKFANICYIESRKVLPDEKQQFDIDSIEEVKKIYEHSNDQVLKNLMTEYIGKKIYVYARNAEDLEKSFEYFEKAGSNIKTMIKCNILLAYVNNNSKYADKVVDLLSDEKNKLTSIQLHVILVLLSNFDISLEKIICKIDTIDYSVLESVSYTAILLLSHQSENVKNSCKEILSVLCAYRPQSITYDLINNIHLPGVKDLILQLQSSNPTISSQMMLISKKMTSISNNYYEKWINALRQSIDLFKEGKKEEALKTIFKLKHTLEVNNYVSISKYNKEFVESYRETLLSLISQLEPNTKQSKSSEKQNLNINSGIISNSSFYLSTSSEYDSFVFVNANGDFDVESATLLLSQMMKKQASLRVIPISSFDEEIEKKSDWRINVFGHKNVKISRVYNCLQKQENGFKVSFIGTNGKKYNFTLQSSSNYYSDHFNNNAFVGLNIAKKIKTSEQFMGLLNSTVTTATKLTHRTIVELSPDVFLIDQLKGHISLYDLVISYYNASHSAKENSLSYELANYVKNIQTNTSMNIINSELNKGQKTVYSLQGGDAKLKYVKSSSNSDFFNRFERVKKFRELQLAHDQRAVAKAIVVTSRNAMAWVSRSSQFARSLGTLSFVAHVMGGLDMSPHAIAFDKLTASVSYTVFVASGKPQPVPFRMTRMIVGALGSASTNNYNESSSSTNNNNNNNDNNNNNNNDNNNNNNNDNNNNNNNDNNNNNNNDNNNNDNNSNNNDNNSNSNDNNNDNNSNNNDNNNDNNSNSNDNNNDNNSGISSSNTNNSNNNDNDSNNKNVNDSNNSNVNDNNNSNVNDNNNSNVNDNNNSNVNDNNNSNVNDNNNSNVNDDNSNSNTNDSNSNVENSSSNINSNDASNNSVENSSTSAVSKANNSIDTGGANSNSSASISVDNDAAGSGKVAFAGGSGVDGSSVLVPSAVLAAKTACLPQSVDSRRSPFKAGGFMSGPSTVTAPTDDHVHVGGPFITAFEQSLQSLRRQKGLFAPCLQLFLAQDIMASRVVPARFIARFSSDDSPLASDAAAVVVGDEEVNAMYGRIDGEKATIKRDIRKLIGEATNANNLIRMPSRWIPWW